jgi:hypothetical protein
MLEMEGDDDGNEEMEEKVPNQIPIILLRLTYILVFDPLITVSKT